MKKLLIILFCITFFFPKSINAQEEEIIGGIASLVALGVIYNQIQEELELFATEYIIENYNLNAFELTINGLGDKSKTFDPSSITVLSFNITPINYEYGYQKKEERIALLVFLDKGWRNKYGIDITKVTYSPFKKETWNDLLGTYIGLASGVKIEDGKVPVYFKRSNSKSENKITLDNYDYEPTQNFKSFKYIEIARKGIENDNKLILPFKKIDGDTYFVEDYSDDYKVIFNEKSLGLFLKGREKGRLVQIKRKLVDNITDFLNH